MKIEILNRDTGAIIFAGEYKSMGEAVEEAIRSGASLNYTSFDGASLDGASLDGASLNGASLDGASLDGASLNYASLNGASLNGALLDGASLNYASLNYASLNYASLNYASLNGASLNYASLNGASLNYASLNGAKGINSFACTPLLMLLDQPAGATLRAYKLVNKRSEGHVNGGLKYEIGKRVEVKNANTDPTIPCAEGINVATLDWCIREWRAGYRILIVEFFKEEIACIPTATDGKFRLFSCTPVAEKNLKEIGLIKPEK